jgi:hypothetical protein
MHRSFSHTHITSPLTHRYPIHLQSGISTEYILLHYQHTHHTITNSHHHNHNYHHQQDMACLLIGGAIYLGDRINTSRKSRKAAKALKLAEASSSTSTTYPSEKKQHIIDTSRTTYPSAAEEKAALEKRDLIEQKEANVDVREGGVHPALRRRGSAGSEETRVDGEGSGSESDADERTLHEEVRDVRAVPVRGERRM